MVVGGAAPPGGGRHFGCLVRGARLGQRAIQRFQNPALVAQELIGEAVARAVHLNGDIRKDPARTRLHHDHPVGQRHRLLDIVGDNQQRGALGGPQGQQVLMQAGAGESIERGERFVQQQHFWFGRQRTGNGDALRLPAGQLARPAIIIAGQAHTLEREIHARPALVPVQILQAEGDIVGHAQPWQQARLLKHEAHGRIGGMHHLAIHLHRAGAGLIQPRHQPQKRGLATARATHQSDDLARRHDKADIRQRGCAALIGLGEGVDRQHVTARPARYPARPAAARSASPAGHRRSCREWRKR